MRPTRTGLALIQRARRYPFCHPFGVSVVTEAGHIFIAAALAAIGGDGGLGSLPPPPPSRTQQPALPRRGCRLRPRAGLVVVGGVEGGVPSRRFPVILTLAPRSPTGGSLVR